MTKKISPKVAALRLEALWYIMDIRSMAYYNDFPTDPNGVDISPEEWMGMISELKAEGRPLLREKLTKLFKGVYEEVTEEDAISEYERDHAERERKLQEERDRLIEEAKKKAKYISELPKSLMVKWSGETEDIGNGTQQKMFFLSGKPRDYGSQMDIFFDNRCSHVKETKDMQNYRGAGGPWAGDSKYRPEGAEVPGIKIYAPSDFDGDTIEIRHN